MFQAHPAGLQQSRAKMNYNILPQTVPEISLPSGMTAHQKRKKQIVDSVCKSVYWVSFSFMFVIFSFFNFARITWKLTKQSCKAISIILAIMFVATVTFFLLSLYHVMELIEDRVQQFKLNSTLSF